MTGVVGAACEQKLESDQVTLNHAFKAFAASGDTLNGLETPGEVLAAMKRSAWSGGRSAALAGAMVDPRLNLVMQTSDQVRSGQARLYWDSGRQRFELATRGEDPGVADVVFDVMAESKGDEVAHRTQRVLYAKESSWVWDYQDQGPATPAAPPPIPLWDGINTVPCVPPVTSPVVQTALLPPVFSIRSGSYPLADLELKLNL